MGANICGCGDPKADDNNLTVELSLEDKAATRLQAFFRSILARQKFKKQLQDSHYNFYCKFYLD